MNKGRKKGERRADKKAKQEKRRASEAGMHGNGHNKFTIVIYMKTKDTEHGIFLV